MKFCSSLGLLEIYNTRIEASNKEIGEVVVKRHLTGNLKVIFDEKLGNYMVDQWKDIDGHIRRRIIVGRITIDGEAEEKLDIFEKSLNVKNKLRKIKKVKGKNLFS